MSLQTEKNSSVNDTRLRSILGPLSLLAVLNAMYLISLLHPLPLTLPPAIISPTTSSQGSKADQASDVLMAQAQARYTANIMARAQQSYYRQHGEFAVTVDELAIDQAVDSALYFYRTFTYRDRQGLVMVAAVPKHQGYKTYLGFVNAITLDGTSEILTEATICQSREAKPLLRRLPTKVPNSGLVSCPIGFILAPMI